MSPRPLRSEDSAFEPALARAREGRLDEAMAAMAVLVREQGETGRRGSAASLAFARLAHLAEAAGAATIALRALDEALRLGGETYADLHFRRACVLLDLLDPREAREALCRALGINPRYLAARLELALLDARDGRLGESLATLRVLGKEHGVQEPRAFQRGLVSLEHADWDGGAAMIRTAMGLSDPAVDGVLDRHHALVAQGEHAAALDRLREAVAAHPGYPDLHFLLGGCEMEAGHLDDALSSLARALELHPDYHAARVMFARALEGVGDLVQARGQVALVLGEDPAHPQALELETRWTRGPESAARLREAGATPAPRPRKAS